MLLYDELLYRNMIKDVSDENVAKKLLNGKNVRVYCGFDPTGESLTVGHLVQIIRMKLLEKYNHTPVVLIGGATGLIGDPKETSERKLLTLEESLHNAKMIEAQIRKYLPNAIYVNNYDWIKKIDLISFLRDYGKNFNVNYMLAKDTVSKRLETGISYTEFSYMILQAIDWLHLYENYDVKIQFGGSDQWGNITSGLELIRKKLGETKTVGMSSPLLLKSDGTKFGKSESGTIWIDENLTSPYELYQYFINTGDDDIENYLKTLTLLEPKEIDVLVAKQKEVPESRIAQKALAEEVCAFAHGRNTLKMVINVSESLFSGDLSNLTKEELVLAYNALEGVEIENNVSIIKALTETNLASSNREARTFIQSGAVSVNDIKVEDFNTILLKENAYYERYMIIRRGKKRFQMVKFK
ncbi:MAG: tyrosine--tRNA ligase [Acholeplasmataceae bacterium]|nr:tyrosine--tRNA ligase [Acholeplasmataceae bacterium]